MMRLPFLACLLAASLLSTTVAAEPYASEYRLSSVLDSAFHWGQAAARWAELVREKSSGRINIRTYPGASLVGGDQTREFAALQQGSIDLAVGSTINWSPQVRELNLFSLPFLLPDHKALDTLTRGEIGRELFAIIEKQGVVPLAWGENGFRELSNSRKAIAWPADMRGLRFRVVGSPLFSEIFQALGARPVQMSWVDAQPALAAGVVDGQENPLSVFIASNMGALGQKYLTLWHYVADPLIFAVNRRVWDSWSVADQGLVRQAAQQAARENIEKARRSQNALAALVAERSEFGGLVVTQLTAAQRASFVLATRPVYDKWRKEIGSELVERAERRIAAAQ